MPELWRKIERPEVIPIRLQDADACYYAREYISHGGYSASEANNLIINLKKPPDKRDTPQWKWKVRAIEQFANELGQLLPDDISVAAVPTSKRRDDPEYDSRLDDALNILHGQRNKIMIEAPFEMIESHQSAHTGGERSVEEFYRLLQWRGFQQVPELIVLVDDVITTGAHFKACQRMIREYHPEVEIAGAFWAKVVWPEVDLDIEF